MKSKIFQFIFISGPSNETKKEHILSVNPNEPAMYFVVAKDEQEARLKAARMIPNSWDIDEVEIVMRPF